MLFAHRMRLMAFGLVGLASAIFTAAGCGLGAVSISSAVCRKTSE